MRLPTASWFGQNFRARFSSTITDFGASAVSDALKKRPLLRRIFMASK